MILSIYTYYIIDLSPILDSGRTIVLKFGAPLHFANATKLTEQCENIMAELSFKSSFPQDVVSKCDKNQANNTSEQLHFTPISNTSTTDVNSSSITSSLNNISSDVSTQNNHVCYKNNLKN